MEKEIIDMLLSIQNEMKVLRGEIKESKPTKYLTNKEAMYMLRIKDSRTIQKLREAGKLPFSEPAGEFLYLRSDVEALFKKHYTARKK